MNCTNCGNNLPENSLFCPSCGTAVQVQVQQPPVQTPVTPQPAYNEQVMYQPPVNNEQAMYQPPVNSEQAMYQPPVNNMQGMYQQPLYNTQATYQQPVNNGQTAFQQGYNPYAAPQKKKSKAPWIALGVSLFLLIGIIALVIVLLVSCSGADNSSPYAVVNSYFDAIADDDAETCLDTVYPAMVSQYEDKGYTEETIYYMLRSDALSRFSASSASFSNVVITTSEQMDNEEIAEGNQELCELEGYIPITAAFDLYGTVTATFNGATVPDSLYWSATVVCADGDYYIVEFSLYY